MRVGSHNSRLRVLKYVGEVTMRQPKITREELAQLVAEYRGEIHRDATRVEVTCPHCHIRKLIPVRYLASFGVACQRCGAALKPV
jgi:hypothetical protein